MATIPYASHFSDGLDRFPAEWRLADIQHLLGNVPLNRIAIHPTLGSATEKDVERYQTIEGKLFELEFGILVEKTMGWYESLIGVLVAHALRTYLDEHDLGQVLGADGLIQLMPGVVKIPDVSFIAWNRFPSERLPRSPIPNLIPNLVVEILSESNTSEEMQNKLHRYFEAGVELVWYIDPTTRTANAFTDPLTCVKVDTQECLEAGTLLPGFTLSLQKLFDKADQQAAKRPH
jgi:Uma2 family endonuclease